MATTLVVDAKTLVASAAMAGSMPTLAVEASALAARHEQAAGPLDAHLAAARLGPYVLLHEIGRGGMGVVYAAFDERLDRKVAIKVLRSQGDAAEQRRFVREAQALARLSHPNVVQIYKIGDFAGSTFLAMEFVDGATLRRWRVDQPRSIAEIVAVMTAAGRGLAAVHAKGLVHRDFKPDNVMIHREGRVLVMDFGLVRGQEAVDIAPTDPRASGSGAELRALLTQRGAVMGTPGYMAPEQFTGRETDARGDQFSFCVSMWELLHEQRPFVGASTLEIEAAVLKGQLSEPRRDEVPGWIRAVLVRGLACEPAGRWRSMTELLAALARDPTPRRRAIVGAGGLLGLVAAVGVGLEIAAADARDATIAGCERAGEEIAADWNDAVADTLRSKFIATGKPHAASSWARGRAWMDAYADEWSALRARVCREARVEGSRDPASEAATVTCLEEWRSSFLGILDVWREADHTILRMAATAAAGLPPLSLCTDDAHLARLARPPASIRAKVMDLQLRLERVKAQRLAGAHREAQRRAESLLPEAQALGWLPMLAQVRLELGFDQAELGLYEPSRMAVEQSFVDAAGSGDELGMLYAATKLSHTVGSLLGQVDRGHYWGRIALALVSHLGMEGSLAEASLRNSVGSIHLRSAAYAQALAFYERALAIYESSLGVEHPAVATSLNNIATVLRNRGDHAEALAPYRRALDIRMTALGPEHPSVGYPLHGLGLSLMALGDHAGARAHLERAIAVRLHDSEPAKLAGSRFGLAQVLWATDARVEAHTLALVARQGFRAAGAGSEKDVARVDRWLQGHPRP